MYPLLIAWTLFSPLPLGFAQGGDGSLKAWASEADSQTCSGVYVGPFLYVICTCSCVCVNVSASVFVLMVFPSSSLCLFFSASHRHTDTQAHRHTDTQTHKYTQTMLEPLSPVSLSHPLLFHCTCSSFQCRIRCIQSKCVPSAVFHTCCKHVVCTVCTVPAEPFCLPTRLLLLLPLLLLLMLLMLQLLSCRMQVSMM